MIGSPSFYKPPSKTDNGVVKRKVFAHCRSNQRVPGSRSRTLSTKSSSSCLYDRATVRSGAEIGLLSLRLIVSQGA